MRFMLFTAALAVSGCTTVAGLQSQRPFIETSSAKPLGTLSGCFADTWHRRGGMSVSETQRERGFTMVLSFSNLGTPVTVAVIDADDRGDHRSVVVHGYRANKNGKLRREVEGCL